MADQRLFVPQEIPVHRWLRQVLQECSFTCNEICPLLRLGE